MDPLEERLKELIRNSGDPAFISVAIASALTEIAWNVGRIADNAERDFEAAVKDATSSEAERLATLKHDDITKRSYIGKPAK